MSWDRSRRKPDYRGGPLREAGSRVKAKAAKTTPYNPQSSCTHCPISAAPNHLASALGTELVIA